MSDRRRRPWIRTWWPVAAIVGAFVVAAVALGPPRKQGAPLDPTSAGPTGTKGVVDVLRSLGADVEVRSRPPDGTTTAALLLADDLPDDVRRELSGWVDGGGTLLLADPRSPLVPAAPARVVRPFLVNPELDRGCELAALRGADRVVAPGVVFRVPEHATGCYRVGEGAWLVAVPKGHGTIVAIGGAGALTNGVLGRADNGVLAVDLLAPTTRARVVVLQPPRPGTGRRGLLGLVPARVKLAVVQLAVAFLVLALSRARRLGRPVVEAQPVELEGSELVVAVGHLLQRARARGQAADLLRDDVRRALADHLGLPPPASAAHVAEVAAGRAGVAATRVQALLAGPAPVDEEALLELARDLELVRREVTRAG